MERAKRMVERISPSWQVLFSREAAEHSERLLQRSAALREQVETLFNDSQRICEQSRGLRMRVEGALHVRRSLEHRARL